MEVRGERGRNEWMDEWRERETDGERERNRGIERGKGNNNTKQNNIWQYNTKQTICLPFTGVFYHTTR
jgi:hypothetical protein